MHLTQPAVSIQLKRLQDQFEIPLTEVIGRQLFVTDFGRQIATVSRKILQEADVIKTTIDQYKGLLTGKIEIAVVSTGKYVIPYFLRAFMEKHPGVEISIDVSNKLKVVEGLAKNESDFSLVSVLPENIPVKKIELMENRLQLVGSARYKDMKITPKNINELTMIYREKGSATRNAMERFFNDNNIVPKKKMELVSNEAVKQAVNAGLGFSIMPLIGLRNLIQTGSVNIFKYKGLPIITQWNLVYNRDKELTPAEMALLEFIEENKQQVINESFGLDHIVL